MSNSQIVLNPGAGGDQVDAEAIGSVKRQRAQLGGAALAEIVAVTNAPPAAAAFALVVRPIPITTSTMNETNVNASVSSVQLVPANATRRGLSIWNDPAGGAGARLYLRPGSTAATTANCPEYIDPGETWYDPYGWVGAVQGIWAAAAGVARVGEYS